jgi:hypothetical protein
VNCQVNEMVQPGTPLVDIAPNPNPNFEPKTANENVEREPRTKNPEREPRIEPEPEHEPGTGK